MTSSEIGLFVLMAIACILWAVCSYAVGFKEGQREGYRRGRAVARHAVTHQPSIIALPSDIKVNN